MLSKHCAATGMESISPRENQEIRQIQSISREERGGKKKGQQVKEKPLA